MNAFLPISIVFFAVGLGLWVSQGMSRGITFIILAFTFFIIAMSSNDEDEAENDDTA